MSILEYVVVIPLLAVLEVAAVWVGLLLCIEIKALWKELRQK